MPGPQFATPRPVSRPKPRRHFSVAQANQTLPLVKRIVRDVVQAHEQATALQMQLTALTGGAEAAGVQAELAGVLAHLQAYVDELQDIGCELKDYQLGLIDFLGQHQGRDVSLCWKLGEDQIGFWHEIHTGFAGRQPISTLHEAE